MIKLIIKELNKYNEEILVNIHLEALIECLNDYCVDEDDLRNFIKKMEN